MVMDWLYRSMLTAVLVALLLLVMQRWGRRVAGLVAGLPAIAAPALAWLAVSEGAGFAAEAAAGCVFAGALCALFALGYAGAGRHLPAGAALVLACVAAASPLPLLALWRPQPAVLLLASLAICLGGACTWRSAHGERRHVARDESAPQAPRVAVTAAVSGAVSGLVGLLAGDLGAFWSGVLSSAPLVAAVVVVRLHVDQGGHTLAPFVRGYCAGLAGRTGFAALFAVLVAPLGALGALLCAGLALALTLYAVGRSHEAIGGGAARTSA
jgi:hypothetical protein